MKEQLQLGYCKDCKQATCLYGDSKCVTCHHEQENDLRGL